MGAEPKAARVVKAWNPGKQLIADENKSVAGLPYHRLAVKGLLGLNRKRACGRGGGVEIESERGAGGVGNESQVVKVFVVAS